MCGGGIEREREREKENLGERELRSAEAHSHSSNPPAMVSMQELSVSEASVCSVDIDEMSLMDED